MENNQALGSTNQVTPSVVCKYCRSTAVRKYGHYWDKQLYFCNLTICILLQFLFRCRTVGGWGWRMTKFSGATLHTGATKTYNPLKRLRGETWIRLKTSCSCWLARRLATLPIISKIYSKDSLAANGDRP